MAPLAVVIPALQEARRLPLLLADLAAAPPGLIAECLVVDGGSSDGTAALAHLAGATTVISPPGRGLQLRIGVAASRAPWLLLLHADARLSPGWGQAVQRAIHHSEAAAERPCAWCFDLAVAGSGLPLRLLERAVAWRSRWRQLPYGDQGLLLPRALLEAAGGIAPLPLMEDLDLMLRLRRIAAIRPLGLPLTVDGRRWRRLGVLGTARRNAALRRAWRRGCSAEELAARYYDGPTAAHLRCRR
ncbi:MAG: TIGR04283 family arsenosugar biosynthesis glycosyltransferase [Vulcanococcus sp.]